MKKTLCLLIVLAMLVGMAPAVFATEGDTVYLEDGKYYISWGDITMQALAEESYYGRAPGGDVNALTEADYVTVTNVGDGMFTMTDSLGRTIYSMGAYSYVFAGNDVEEGYLWTLIETDGGYNLMNVDTERVVSYSEYYEGWVLQSSASLFEGSIVNMTAVPEEPAGTPLADGDNVIELPYMAEEASVYTYVATATGPLYIMTTNFMYCGQSGEYYDNNEYMSDWTNYTTFTVNGEELEGAFYGSVEVVEGETYTFSWAHQEGSPYGFQATINLSYTDELIPIPGIGIELFPSDLPRNTVEIPANGTQLYKISWEFAGYILRIYGENVYLYYETYDWWNGWVTVRIDAEDGVLEYDLSKNGCNEFYIGNDGDEAAAFAMDCYAPVGGEKNPIIVENLEDIHVSFTAETETTVYFQWTASEVGTITVIPGSVNIYFYNVTADENGQYDDSWTEYSVYVQPGDVLQIVVGGYLYEDLEYYFTYEFEAGYRAGSEQNPIEVDLLQTLTLNMYNETVYYSWTPSESMTVELNFTYNYSWSSNLPTMTISGEVFNFGVIAYGGTEVVSTGDQLTVTAGEPIIFSLSTTPSVYGTLVATEVEATVEGDGTEENPWIIESLPYVIENTFGPEYEYGHFYNVTITEAGTVYVESFSGCMVSFMVNGEWGYIEPFEVEVGDVVTIAPWGSAEGDYTISVGFTPSEGGEEGDDLIESTNLVIGDNAISIASGETFSPEYTFTPETDGMLTLGLVFLESTYWDQVVEYTTDEIAEMLAYGNIGLQVDDVDYTEPVAVTAGTPVTITMSQGRMYSMYGYSWKATLNLSLGEDGEEGGETESATLILGDNALEQDITYTYTVEEAGTLALEFYNVKWHTEWSSGNASASELTYYFNIAINGTCVSSFYNTMEVEVGDVITVLITSLDGCVYSADLEIAYVVPEEMFLGDNELAPYQQYNFTATQTGTLYFTVKDLNYDYGNAEEWALGNSVNISINGTAITTFQYSIEVEEGDVVTIIMQPNYYSWDGILNISYEGFYEHPLGSERNPIKLTYDDCPTETPEIPAGEELIYELDGFTEATLTIYGENAYVVYSDWDNAVGGYVDYYVYAENGVLTFNPGYVYDIRIGNAGTEAAKFTIEAYIPEGKYNNPDELEEGDNIAEVPAYNNYYFFYIPEEDGTLTITVTGEFWTFNVVNEGLTDSWEDNQYSDYLYAAWSETNTITMEVKAGEYIRVTVGSYNPDDYSNSSPAITATVTMDFVPAGGEEEIVAGDANNDGVVNYLDAMLVAQFYVGDITEEELNVVAADVNGDGDVNYLDAMLIAQFYVGDIESFEPEE